MDIAIIVTDQRSRSSEGASRVSDRTAAAGDDGHEDHHLDSAGEALQAKVNVSGIEREYQKKGNGDVRRLGTHEVEEWGEPNIGLL